jgi:mRNA interferase MazF
VVISQGEIWWADLPQPIGSEPGFLRPVVVVQGDAFNRSRLLTAVCVVLTSNLRWADVPGYAVLEARATGLPRDSVALVSQVITVDLNRFMDRVGVLLQRQFDLVLAGLDVMLGRV